MKLLTLNCHSWQEENQIKKIKYLAKAIKENEYDIIAFQEISRLRIKKINKDNFENKDYLLILLEELKSLGIDHYNYMWDFSHIGYNIYEEGLAILTKYKILNKKSFFISQCKDINYWKSRKIIGATIEYNNNLIDVYSCHLGWWHDEDEPFKTQITNLLKEIKSDRLSFFMGDFNNSATVREEGYDYLLSKELLDTYNLAENKDDGFTVTGKIAGWEKNSLDLRLDIIFVNKPIYVKESKIIFNGSNKAIISDHFAVEAQVEL
ncbi:endonuclease/exonuclease/phosphatase family protein [Clostridium tarantellae]|uniref:Endonuclease n=1 Tax=Clostridium tarantellae TaxID=39493 RepID=A0A6I1MP56_9CLOT|nr:endonuclease/exonuclease/phosphatase family protein [Clostridium tarantellae]MPQ44012.1 endonuclease [Clostridium tarantellae]